MQPTQEELNFIAKQSIIILGHMLGKAMNRYIEEVPDDINEFIMRCEEGDIVTRVIVEWRPKETE